MTLLICGLILFLGIHSVSIFADKWRNAQVAKLGIRTWKVFYSLISIAGLAMMTIGYLQPPGQTTPHYDLVTPALGLANHRLLQLGLSNLDRCGLCS